MSDAKPKEISGPNPEWYKQDILDMLRDDMSEDEIYKTVYTSITDAQYREALEWAKQQISLDESI